ncbi:hypothetical protein [Bacteroides luti]|nr:hypothetical protein [Bacteroides luti]
MRPVYEVPERAAVVERVAVASLGLSLRDGSSFSWLNHCALLWHCFFV